MQFFFYEIAARIVAIYLCVDCSQKLWHGLNERKIKFINTDIVNWLLGWSDVVYHRDATPVRYWMQIGRETTALVACLFVAIMGWWHPTA
jgi:hypothetical protein